MLNADNVEQSSPLTCKQDAPILGSSGNGLFLLDTAKEQQRLQNARDACLNGIFHQSMPLARATLSEYNQITTEANKKVVQIAMNSKS